MADKTTSSPDHVSVQIVGVGMFLPEPDMTVVDVARKSGLAEWVVREGLGIGQTRMAGPDGQSIQMPVWTAQACVSKCDIPLEEIQLVLCTTEEWKEYPQWTASRDAQRLSAGCGA